MPRSDNTLEFVLAQCAAIEARIDKLNRGREEDLEEQDTVVIKNDQVSGKKKLVDSLNTQEQ
jgi:hypothetical protein